MRKSLKIDDQTHARLRIMAQRERLSLAQMAARAVATLWLICEEEERQRAALARTIYRTVIQQEGDDDANSPR